MDWEPQGAGFEPPLDWGPGPTAPVSTASAPRPSSAPVTRRATPSRYATAREALHTVFGYDDFRGDQAAIVDQVIAGGDAVVLMPTGGARAPDSS
jgi:ATP-dependent DNA helicase RecQ